MKKRFILILVLLVLILGGTYFFYISRKTSKPISKKEYYGIFDVNYDITYDGLLEEGFVEDGNIHGAYVFVKQVNDTLETWYQVDHTFKIITHKVSIIETPTFNIELVKQMIDKNDAYIITNLCIDSSGVYDFFAKGSDNDLLFECLYSRERIPDKITLMVAHAFPIAARGGMFKDHPYYKAIEQSELEAEIEGKKIEEELKELENK